MKSFKKILALGVVIAASSSLALADQMIDPNNLVNGTGYGSYTNGSTPTLTFDNSLTTTSFGDMGLFANVNGGNLVFNSTPLVLNFPSPYNLELFSITNPTNNDMVTFFGTSDTYSFVTSSMDPACQPSGATCLIVNGQGYFTSNYFSGDVYGTYDISSQGEVNAGQTLSFSGTGYSADVPAAVTPEPNSLVLLGTGLLGAAGMLFMKRRANGLV